MIMRPSLKQHVGLLPDDVSRGPKLSKSLSCVASLDSAQPLSSYHIDALASRLSPDTKDICRDNSMRDPATMLCLELDQLTAPPFNINTYPVCDLESSRSVLKLALM